MRLLTRLRLYKNAKLPAKVRDVLEQWEINCKKASWRSFADVAALYGAAVQEIDSRVVFFLGDERFVVTTNIDYETELIHIRATQTHAEYSRENSKNKR
jgi:mRNA-degrading endonuclease HigB of HigAB toxin-antitoxin module